MEFKDQVIQLLNNKINEAEQDDKMFGDSCNVFKNEIKLFTELKDEIQNLREVKS